MCIHPDHPIKLFCQTCNQPFCYECFDYHDGHLTYKYEKKEVSDVLQNLQKVLQEISYDFESQNDLVFQMNSFKGTNEELESIKKNSKFPEFFIGLEQFKTDYENFKSTFMQMPKGTELQPPKVVDSEIPPIILPRPRIVPQKYITPTMGFQQNLRILNPQIPLNQLKNPTIIIPTLNKIRKIPIPKNKPVYLLSDYEAKSKEPKIKKKIYLTWKEIFVDLMNYLPFEFFKEVSSNTKRKEFDSLIYNSKEYNNEELMSFIDELEKKSVIELMQKYINEKKINMDIQANNKKEFLNIVVQNGISIVEATEKLDQISIKQIEDMMYGLSSSSLLKIQNDIFKTNNTTYKDKSSMIVKILNPKRFQK